MNNAVIKKIRSNAKKQIATMWATSKTAFVHCLDNDFSAEEVPVANVKLVAERCGAEYFAEGDSYRVRLHSNCWFILRK